MIVEHEDGPLLVVAGPGSGKTRVLTERIRWLLNKREGHFRILALTFTNKAANEMKERLAEIPKINERTFIGTFHSFCMEVLANRGKSVGIEGIPNILDSYQDRRLILLQAIMDNDEMWDKIKLIQDNREQDRIINNWLNMISTAKNNLCLPEMLDDEKERKIYESYNERLKASNVIDFDDLLLLTYRLFQERPIIADFYRRQYRYICIDEAQDLNEAQYQVLSALCGEEYRNVMAVGDPKQAIFVWNGANPKYLDHFERDFGARKISMNENFRSSRVVVKAAKSLDPEYEIYGTPAIAGEVKLIVGDNEQHEANLVLDYIQNLIDKGHKDVEGPITLESCALLGRNRYVLNAIEKELNKRDLTYYKQLSSQHESESKIMQDFELGLHLIANPKDKLHRGILLKRWRNSSKSIPHENATNGLEMIKALRNSVSSRDQQAVVEALEKIEWTEHEFKFLKALDYLNNFSEDKGDQEERALIMEDIEIWRKHWDYYLRSQPGGSHSLIFFLGHVALGTTQQPRQEGLALLTIHSAKGLEFDVVVVMGMVEGTFPDYRAKKDALIEEKRNAFVAVTRSKRLLVFSYPKEKTMPWGSSRKQKPSRYLADLGLI
jgi:DNA helicase-2/ATP-dependent DNA helicase PcrA